AHRGGAFRPAATARNLHLIAANRRQRPGVILQMFLSILRFGHKDRTIVLHAKQEVMSHLECGTHGQVVIATAVADVDPTAVRRSRPDAANTSGPEDRFAVLAFLALVTRLANGCWLADAQLLIGQ